MLISVLGIDFGTNVCSLVELDETGVVVLRRALLQISIFVMMAVG
ncbi:hypothetical protein ACFYE9_32595 [Rhizobium leguminosarum]|uniref:Uncharacterized protein n=1 Tax=Rhizobium leguminosarum TaxID=384 RepID=A0ACD5FE16_RHILE|nr:hypothetical protein [Rhizobium leguminosarum]